MTSPPAPPTPILDFGRQLSLIFTFIALIVGPVKAQSTTTTAPADPLWEVGVAAFGLNQQVWPGAS